MTYGVVIFSLSQLFQGKHRRWGSKYVSTAPEGGGGGTTPAPSSTTRWSDLPDRRDRLRQAQQRPQVFRSERAASPHPLGTNTPFHKRVCGGEGGRSMAWGVDAAAMTCVPPRLKSGDDRREIGRFCVCVVPSSLPQSRYALPSPPLREERRERRELSEGRTFVARDHIITRRCTQHVFTYMRTKNRHTQAISGSRDAASFPKAGISESSYGAWREGEDKTGTPARSLRRERPAREGATRGVLLY